MTHNGYVMLNIGATKIQAHRAAWLYMTGELPILDIDHLNGVRSDNRWENLREVTRQQNLQNQRAASKNNLSGFLGVSPKRDKFAARITVNRKMIRLGVFNTAEEAHAEYIKAKRKYHCGGTL